MKAEKCIRGLILMALVICSVGFSGCSDLAEAGSHAIVNFQSAKVRKLQTGDNITIGPATYSSETRGFDSSWPFGPESSPQ
jgi:hypothetical protein